MNSLTEVASHDWDQLERSQDESSPFMRYAYLDAMIQSQSACGATGWTPLFITLSVGAELHGACALFIKDHSYGEYVFDWAWARAYHQHGVSYYPKVVAAVPFTPVPGARLLARDEASRIALIKAILDWCKQSRMSSMHMLFGSHADLQSCQRLGLMVRHTIQFHWTNIGSQWRNFEEFLSTLNQEKRKKIKQERRKVADALVSIESRRGRDISETDWDFFYTCYERTYLEHGNPPYLNRDFFHRMARSMPENWLLFIATRQGQPIASSLIALDSKGGSNNVAFGRYWGALESISCLHFELCYYQPIQWCIANGFQRFEGGAQGEHKMARALMPVTTSSAHWIAHPEFSAAIAHFLEQEHLHVRHYLDDLRARSPMRVTSHAIPIEPL